MCVGTNAPQRVYEPAYTRARVAGGSGGTGFCRGGLPGHSSSPSVARRAAEAHVEDDRVAGVQAAQHLGAVDGVGVLRADVGPSGKLGVRTVPLSDPCRVVPQARDAVAGERVVDAVAARSGQSRFALGLEVR